MTYRKAIAKRRTAIYEEFRQLSPAPLFVPHESDTPVAGATDSSVCLTAEDKQLLASGDKAAMRARLTQLDEYVLKLDQLKQAKLEVARDYGRRAKEEHDKIKACFDDIVRGEFRTRNKFGELLCGVYLSEVLGYESGTLLKDCYSLQTPFGLRRFDAFFVEKRIGLESKIGYQVLDDRLKLQIKKDEYLLSSGAVSEVHWLIHTRASKALIARLSSTKISVANSWLTVEIKQMILRERQMLWLPEEALSVLVQSNT